MNHTMPDATGRVIAIGGSAWRNRPLAYLESAARDGSTASVVLARDGADLQAWMPCLWPEVEVRSVDAQDAEADETVLRLWAGALGVASFSPENGFQTSLSPLRPDLAVLHFPYADEEGCAYLAHPDGHGWFERLIVAASRRVVVVADEILTVAQSRRLSRSRFLEGAAVEEVVHVPYGAFPGSCDGLYRQDPEAQTAYTRILAESVVSGLPVDRSEFLARLVKPERLAAVSLPHGLDWPPVE